MKKIKSTKEKNKIKKRKKILLKAIAIILLFITTINVKAGTEDSKLTRNVIEGYYSIVTESDGNHLYYLELYQMNGQTVYCIEVGTSITTDTYNSTTDLTISNLTDTQLEYIKKIMYFGYDYINHNDYRYYMAAQEMIWEYLGNEVYWTTEFDKNGSEYNIDSYKNEIKNLIENLNILPSFSGYKDKILAGTSISRIDYNNVLSDFTITQSANQTYEIKDNTLTVTTNSEEENVDEIILTRNNYYNNDTILYYNDTSQKLISAGKITMPTATYTVTSTDCYIFVRVIDSETKKEEAQGQASLTGAVYELYDENDNKITTFTSEEGVRLKIENLYPKKYYIKQITASPGYKINETITEFKLNVEFYEVKLQEEVIKSNLEILKLYGDSKTDYQSESDITFKIYDNNNNLYQTITTDKVGYAQTELIYGTYTISQENTTNGYNKVEDFTLTIDENTAETIRYNLFDDKIKVKIKINTLDKETEKNIQEKNIQYKIKNDETNEYLTYNGEDIFLTEEDGSIIIPIELPYGTYELEQISTPNNYLLNEEILSITIDENSLIEIDDKEEIIINVNYYNEPIKGQIKIITNEENFTTTDSNYDYELIPRPNIEIEIITKNDIIDENGQIIYSEDEVIETITTNDKGEAISSIVSLGNYCVKEKNTETEEYCFTIEKINNIINPVIKEITLTNEILKYNVELINLDIETKDPIEGTIIELYTEDNILINTSITNEDGIIKISSLKSGKYYFKETEIKGNYILNEERLYFEIKDENLNLEIYNTKETTTLISIPNTLSNKSPILPAIFLTFILIGIALYVKTKKKHHNNNNN